jgi:hypothetical protein
MSPSQSCCGVVGGEWKASGRSIASTSRPLTASHQRIAQKSTENWKDASDLVNEICAEDLDPAMLADTACEGGVTFR